MKHLSSSLLMAVCLSTSVSADTLDTSLNALQRQWATVNYTVPEDNQEEAFETLLSHANQAVKQHPNSAEYLIWQGIIQSSTAGAAGGLDALSLVKDARHSFEQAIDINANALNGSAYTSLGVLYHKVPAWPIGFGSDSKAKKLFERALTLNPDGIDSNYFYAEFLYDKEHYQEAKTYLLKAQQAKPRADRPLADQGRLQEIEALLKKVNQKIG